MEGNKEIWINRILDSTQHMQNPAVNPYLYQKTMNALKTRSAAGYTSRQSFSFRWAAAFLLIAGINIVSAIHLSKRGHTDVPAHMKAAFDNQVIYNY